MTRFHIAVVLVFFANPFTALAVNAMSDCQVLEGFARIVNSSNETPSRVRIIFRPVEGSGLALDLRRHLSERISKEDLVLAKSNYGYNEINVVVRSAEQARVLLSVLHARFSGSILSLESW